MSVPEVLIAPVGFNPQVRGIAEPEMRAVKLGLRPSRAMPAMVKLAHFFEAKPLPPVGPGYGAKAKASLAKMYANDRYGCCVITGKFHGVGVRSANDLGEPALGTDTEVVSQYQSICGPGDNGCYIPEVLDHMVRTGLTVGGVKRKLDGWAQVSPSNRDLCRAVLIALGGFTIGFNVPGEWMGSNTYDGATWDTPRRYSFVGGHDVFVFDYDEVGYWVSTWGVKVRMTYAAFEDSRIVSEAYAELGPDWYNSDKLSPAGFDVAALKTALATASAGGVPIWEKDPEPTPPPSPPVPPAPPARQVANVMPVTVPISVSALGGILKLSGSVTIPGQMAEVVAASAMGPFGDHANWQEIVRLVSQLAMDIAASNWPAVLPDILAILQALHVFGVRLGCDANQVAALQVSWWTLLVDLAALGWAVKNRDIPGIIAALKKVAEDLGLVIG